MKFHNHKLKLLRFGLLYLPLIIYLLITQVQSSDDELNADEDIPVIEGIGGPVIISEENDVLVLTKDNFLHVTGTREIILVEFYAPWCGHCKSLEPEYALAAKELSKDGIRIGKVDGTVEDDLAKEFDVTGYPSIKLFKKGAFVEDYDGARTSTGIVEYMKKHADPNYKPPLSAVKVLSTANFSDFVNSEKLSLVEFYAPWCGHCKQLAPEYEGAAQDLKEFKIPLAKVDTTEEQSLAKEHDVHGYPKLLVFRNGRSFEYKGPRDRRGIANYMKEQAELPSVLVNTTLQAKNRIPRTDSFIFAYFKSQNKMYEEYLGAANQMRGENIFLHTFDEGVASHYDLSPDSINIIFPEIYHSKYEDQKPTFKKVSGSQSDISSWIVSTIVPLVGSRTRANAESRYSRRPLLVVYYDVDFSHQHVKATQFVRNKILPVANAHRDITFAISNEDEFDEDLKAFGLDDSGEDVNAGIFGETNLRYKMDPEEDFDYNVLEEFILKYKKGLLKPYMKSQPVPRRQEGPVRAIVAETFEDEVLNSEKDVLIEFYAPWCGHCNKLEPIWKKVAKYFAKERPNLVVAKMDATANDVHPNFNVRGFPTIYLLKADDKSHPVLFEEGDRTLSGFKDFIAKHFPSSPSKEEL